MGGQTFRRGANRLITDCGPILIVDRDEGSRAFASRLFERAGFATEQAVNGNDAMALVRRVRPCLVLLEVLLPDVSGFEIASELRDEFGGPADRLHFRRTNA